MFIWTDLQSMSLASNPQIRSKKRKRRTTSSDEPLLGNDAFRQKYKELLSHQSPTNSNPPWSHREICFQHTILPLLQNHNLLPHQQLTFDPSALGCQSGCGRTAIHIQRNSMSKVAQFPMSSLNLSFNNRTASMDDLIIEIHNTNPNSTNSSIPHHPVIARHHIKLQKLMASGIKRCVQPTTVNSMVCSASFCESELHFVLHAAAPMVIMGIGLRRDGNGKFLEVTIPNSNDIPKSMAAFWYQNWCIHGIQEDMATHRLYQFIAIHHNKFLGDMVNSLNRIAMTFYVQKMNEQIPSNISIIVNGKSVDQYPQISPSNTNHSKTLSKSTVQTVTKKVRFDPISIARKETKMSQRLEFKVPDLTDDEIEYYLKRYNEEVMYSQI